MNIEDIPPVSAEQLLSDAEQNQPAVIAMMADPGIVPIMASMGLLMQDAVIGECKECTCGVCMSIRQTGQSLVDYLESKA